MIAQLELIRRPGMYLCSLCGKISTADALLAVDEYVMHSGCIIKWVRRESTATIPNRQETL